MFPFKVGYAAVILVTLCATVAWATLPPDDLTPLFLRLGSDGNSTTEAPNTAPRSSDSLSWQASVTLASCVALLVVLSFDLIPCSVAMFSITMLLRVCGIISTADALAGLSNSSLLTVQLLVVLIAPIARLPLAQRIIRSALQSTVLPPSGQAGKTGVVPATSLSFASLKLCLLSYALSWFVGNIPVTAMIMPLVHQYCIEHDLPSSQLLMPMEIATLIGGTFSKIGVSTTMLVSGMMEANGLPTLAFFELAKVSGVPAILALVYLTYAPKWLLPRTTKGVVAHVREKASTYVSELLVLSTSPLIGLRVGELRTEHFPETLDIFQVICAADGTVHAPPDDSLVIHASDTIGLTGPIPLMELFARKCHLEWHAADSVDGSFAASQSSAATPTNDSSPLTLKEDKSHVPGTLGQSFARMSMCKQRASVRRSLAHAPSSAQPRVSMAIAAEAEETNAADDGESVFAEVVLSNDAVVIGRSANAIRRFYRMAIVGFRRKNTNLSPSELVAQHLSFQGGDTLLLLGPKSCFQRYGLNDFLVVTFVDRDGKHDHDAASDDAPRFVVVPKWFPFGNFLLSSGTTVANDPISHSVLKPQNRESSPLLSPAAGQHHGTLSPRHGHPDNTVTVSTSTPVPSAAGGGGMELFSPKYVKVIQVPRWYPYVSLLVFAAAISCSIAGMDLVICCGVAVLAMLALQLRRWDDAIKSMKLEVFLVMAFSFGLGHAMTKSGLSLFVATKLSESGLSGFSLLLVIGLASSGLGNIISTKAAVQVLFPVVLDIATQSGDDVLPYISVLAVCVVISLATPFAHASALIIMGPGGYTTADFYRFGIPINVLLVVMMATSAYLVYLA